MTRKALFAGLVFDEADHPAETAYVGAEPCYVINDAGFRRHLPSEPIDRQVLNQIASLVRGNEDALSAQTAKMMGSDDPFSRAIIEKQLKNLDQQFDSLFEAGFPEEMRAYLGMTGFKVLIDYNGHVVSVVQPGSGEE
ncbi:MAG: hypothetical protein CO094_05825 [Anaerolineae bacterium CG_4_9_14_3_um_filter_57_17]|nr:hypothetical protein [bacterium]NCT20751.1 hypothetical protein [bacterium]OIO84091.1 MAG: hypothetical protein AUK01_10620 [Anaerolineae bacterium CG2_30_57_67]PJB66872.1 MAG: hypothetical protein CO094_05825 [Anaerolineae bacterium CG_4_9_14_3_um_filter_57_17]